MAAGSIRFSDTRTAYNLGVTITENAKSLVNVINKLSNTNDEIKQAWAGSDSSYYSEKLTQQCTEMKKIISDIETFGEIVKSAAIDYENEESNT